MGLVLAYPDELNVMLSPAIGILTAMAVGLVLYRGCRHIFAGAVLMPFLALATIAVALMGVYCGYLVANWPGASIQSKSKCQDRGDASWLWRPGR